MVTYFSNYFDLVRKLTGKSVFNVYRLSNDFCDKVQGYLNGGFERDGERINASEPTTDLQELIVNSAGGVKRCVQNFCSSNLSNCYLV
jgi:hypothetical protein